MNYERLETGISNWAKEQDPVRAAVVIGSRAREDRTPDAWSDLDLMLFVTDPQRYVEDTSWLAAFGEARSRRIYGRLRAILACSVSRSKYVTKWRNLAS